MKQVILYLTHLLPDDILHEFQRLAASVQPVAPVRLLFHQTREQTPAQLRSQPVYRFTDDDITALACPMLGERFVPGSIHLPVLKFFQDHGDYDYYWYVENDVRFTGDWRAFFEPFSAVPGDLLTSHIRRYQEEPWWDRWRLTHPREEIPRRRRLRSFNPICRFSRRALEVLWEAQRDGWCGHQEVLLPTLLHERGCQLVEISGQGAFVPPGFADRFYTAEPRNRRGKLQRGTMRFRPCFYRAGELPNTLYHPVSPAKYRPPLLQRTREWLSRLSGRIGSVHCPAGATITCSRRTSADR